MSAREFNERVTIYTRTMTVNSFGQPVEKYVELFNPRCAIKYTTGGKTEENRHLLNIHSITFKTWYNSKLNETCLLKYEDRFYNIVFIRPIKRKLMFLETELITEPVNISTDE